MTKPVFWEQNMKNIISLSPAELAQTVVKVNRNVKFKALISVNFLLSFFNAPHILLSEQ